VFNPRKCKLVKAKIENANQVPVIKTKCSPKIQQEALNRIEKVFKEMFKTDKVTLISKP
jgi:hypothetical protein